MADLDRRKAQNLVAPRPDTRAVTPSSRDFAQALQRGRSELERVPVLRGARADLVGVARALDEAEALALAVSLDDPQAELSRFAETCRAVSVPVLRCDLLLEEFQIYESRVAGADAVLLRASLLSQDLLERLAQAARSTHMTALVACASEEEVARAVAARAQALLLDRAVPAPPRMVLLAERVEVSFRGVFDAALDVALGDLPDPAAAFRAELENS